LIGASVKRSTSLLVAALTAAAGCSYRTDNPLYGLANGNPPVFRVVGSDPKDGASELPLGTAFQLVFSDFPDPASVGFGPITLRSGLIAFDFDATTDLVGPSGMGQDLMGPAVWVRPRRDLTPNTEYVVVFDGTLLSLSGTTVEPTMVRYTTGTMPGGAPPAPPTHTLATDVQPILDAHCALDGCHSSQEVQAGLVLSAGRSRSSLVGTVASENSMLRVKPNDPANSYLIRKLLGAPGIVGDQMPIGIPLDQDTLRVLSDWILEGAN
jgi:hypothetical protein